MRLIRTARNSAKYFYPSFVTFTSFYEFVKLSNRELHLATTHRKI